MAFRLKWPTKSRTVTQNFLANPEIYQKFSLPGHEGLDISTKNGDDVSACADGVVVVVETNPNVHNYGIHVRIDHATADGQFQTTYAHLQEAKVIVGQNVKAGDLIGLAGVTGNTTGPICI